MNTRTTKLREHDLPMMTNAELGSTEVVLIGAGSEAVDVSRVAA